jgi:hypothetical protein
MRAQNTHGIFRTASPQRLEISRNVLRIFWGFATVQQTICQKYVFKIVTATYCI